MANVKHPMPRPIVCDCCRSSDIDLLDHSVIYGRRYSDWPLIWYCWACKALVGCHAGTDIPLGTMADKETRTARKECHDVFDRLWKKGPMTRTEAYAWLGQCMGLSEEQCHISRFNVDQCHEAVRLSIDKRKMTNEHSRQAARRRKQRT